MYPVQEEANGPMSVLSIVPGSSSATTMQGTEWFGHRFARKVKSALFTHAGVLLVADLNGGDDAWVFDQHPS